MAPISHIKKNCLVRLGPTSSSDNSEELSITESVKDPVDEVDFIYNRLLREAPYISSDEVEFQSVSSSDISWVDPSLVEAGQAFVATNFFSLICAHLGALLYGFSFKSLSTLLLRTGNSGNVEVSLVRYLSTFIHLKTWYESNIIDGSANGYADVQRVKKMHLLALRQYKKRPLDKAQLNEMEESIRNPEREAIMRAVRKDLSPIPTEEVPHHLITYFPPVPMSQFDLVMTQVLSKCSLNPEIIKK